MTPTTMTPDLTIAEAGRRLMADELATLQTHWPDLRLSAGETAVHETRKAIRRTFTLFKLFAPYFAADRLESYRPGLRKVMRRLAPCRDAAVFRLKLATYNESATSPLVGLAAYWNERQVKADRKLRVYLGRRSVSRRLDRYALFTATAGAGLPAKGRAAPVLVRHALPALVFQRLAAVRAWGDILPSATPDQFHQLRIQFKELRYTLGFFESLIGESGGPILGLSRQMQEHLGHLNDASVAVDYLEHVRVYPMETAIYLDFQRSELDRLTSEFLPIYAGFDRPEVRCQLAVAVNRL